MSEQRQLVSPSFQEIIERQGLDTNAGPDDFRIERAVHGNRGKQPGDWYAIPTKIFVTNPQTLERETGTLAENGAFVSEDVEIKGYRDEVSLSSRVMILGKSVLRSVHVGDRTIINGAFVEYATIGKDSSVAEGATIQGVMCASRPRIGNSVRIGKEARVSHSSRIYDRSRIGNGVWVVDSTVGFNVVTGATDKSDRTPVRDTFRGHRTFIGRSVVKDNVAIETNAQIEGSTIGNGATIGLRADLEYTEIAENKVIPHDTKILELHPDKKAARAAIERSRKHSEENLVRKPLLRTQARMKRWWVANEQSKIRASHGSE